MYKINRKENDIIKLESRLFKELKIRERDHLQEWIVKNPEMLGEDLLIIQKEFNGFNDTSERLDLLAIDKEGGLVIIENKLDDTGRNVVWQALKYTSYCSTLNTKQIIRIYQDYLTHHQHGTDAKESLLEFLELDEEELLLNDIDQRIIFVANHFRKEVTSTVLWLLDHEIKIQCFRATPYSMGEEIFLQIEQIIPLPETEEFMINAKEKVKEERGKSKIKEESQARLVEFWSLLKNRLRDKNLKFLDNVSPKGTYGVGFWKGRGGFNFCISHKTLRVELYFPNDSDKSIIETMSKYREQMEKSFGKPLIFERLDTRKASRIKTEIVGSDINLTEGRFVSKENWEPWLDWFSETIEPFYRAVYPVWAKVRKELDI